MFCEQLLVSENEKLLMYSLWPFVFIGFDYVLANFSKFRRLSRFKMAAVWCYLKDIVATDTRELLLFS